MKIKVLPESVYSKIAAGEVIDKPASIIRELIDNSIDAESTEIVISLKKGGIEEICVRDNGCGMEADDLPVAVRRHATSKIKTAEDAVEFLNQFGWELTAAPIEVKEVTIPAEFDKVFSAYNEIHLRCSRLTACGKRLFILHGNENARLPRYAPSVRLCRARSY